MSQQELLKRLVDFLDEAEVPYMLTGSVASSLHGEPRSTHDLDVVVVLDRKSVAQLLQTFRTPEYYLDEGSVREAVESCGTFNLISLEEGDKVDFWMLTQDPFDQSRFARKTTIVFMGKPLVVSSPEDTILAKLNWARLSGGSEKQIHDARRIFEVQYGSLDLTYLREWAKRLSLEDSLERIEREAHSA
jgi:hypothetical protein